MLRLLIPPLHLKVFRSKLPRPDLIPHGHLAGLDLDPSPLAATLKCHRRPVPLQHRYTGRIDKMACWRIFHPYQVLSENLKTDLPLDDCSSMGWPRRFARKLPQHDLTSTWKSKSLKRESTHRDNQYRNFAEHSNTIEANRGHCSLLR